MPGIVGIVTKIPRELAEAQLLRMVKSLRHESFYNTGIWIDESSGVYVGWIVRGGAFADGMPLHNEKEDLTLVFSGEESSAPDTPVRLRNKGHEVELKGASYLVHLAEEDPSFPAGLNGCFHGLLVNRKSQSARLFNDRYGMHRVYCHESKDAFYFAAEAKAILAVRPELRAIEVRGLGEFIACGCVLENRTMFPGIQVLPPASAWAFERGSLKQKANYFDPRQWEEQTPLDEESYYQELRAVFARSLPRYFCGQERVGMSLTGGLDTRMILAWHKAPRNSLPCYTFGGTFRECQDVQLARQVARICGQPHRVIPADGDFLSQFPRYAERAVYLSDGCVEVTRSVDLYVNEQARSIAPVRMTGNYGSEVLRWTPAFKVGKVPGGLFGPDLSSSIEAAGETYARIAQGHPVSFAVFRQAPWHHYGLHALEQTQLSVRTPFLDNDVVRTAFRAPRPAFAKRDAANTGLCLRLVAEGNPALGKLRTDRGLGGRNGLAGKAVRQYLEFTFKSEYAYDYGMPQWLAGVDHALAPLHLERLFLGRHKFAHYRLWYRDDLSGYLKDVLLDSKSLSRPYLQKNAVEAIVKGHTNGNRNYTTEIHKLLTLELMHRLLLESL